MCSQCFPLWYWMLIFFTVLLWSFTTKRNAVGSVNKGKKHRSWKLTRPQYLPCPPWNLPQCLHHSPKPYCLITGWGTPRFWGCCLSLISFGWTAPACSFTICWVYADFCVLPRHSVLRVSPAARSRTHRSQPLHMLKWCWTQAVEISIKFIFRDWMEDWECIWRGSHTHTYWTKLMVGCPAVLFVLSLSCNKIDHIPKPFLIYVPPQLLVLHHHFARSNIACLPGRAEGLKDPGSAVDSVENSRTMVIGQICGKVAVIGQNCKVAKNSQWSGEFGAIGFITKYFRDWRMKSYDKLVPYRSPTPWVIGTALSVHS